LRNEGLKQGAEGVGVISTLEEDRAMKSTTEKRQYTTPTLTAHGTLEEVTQQQNKGWGSTDGYLFMGVPISNIS
jgi:hypothetical protein